MRQLEWKGTEKVAKPDQLPQEPASGRDGAGSWLDRIVPKSDVPEGQSGKWRVTRFEVTANDVAMFALRAPSRAGSPGIYTKLVQDRAWGPMMSDTDAERADLVPFVNRATGRVLINGLGLGVGLAAVLRKPDVISVRVIEINPDIINLVAQHFSADDRIEILEADALTYRPQKGERFDAVWHDIWPDLCADNLPQMKELHRAYGKRTAWQASWGREICEYHARRRF